MTMTIKAAVFHGPGKPMTIEQLELEDPRNDEVLIKVIATGLCHSDLHNIDGSRPIQTPAVLGHESAGIVIGKGDAVHDLQIGDHVIPFVLPECGECTNCRSGKTNICLKIRERTDSASSRLRFRGVPVHTHVGLGTFADHIVVKADRVAKIRPDTPFDGASYLSCGGATGIGSVLFAAKVDEGSSVAVFGLGGVGLNVVQGARLAGAKTIIGIDINPDRGDIAKAHGATHFIDPRSTPDVVRAVTEITGVGADFTFECVGSIALIEQAIASANPFYGRVTLIGITPAGSTIPVAPSAFAMGRQLTGASMGGCMPKRDLPRLADWYVEGKVKLDGLISRHLRLEDINEGFELMIRGESIRSVIMFD